MQKILEVTEVRLAVLESFPPKLRIRTSGTVPSGGWNRPQLIPYVYIQAPPDGIYDFDFVAEPPDAPAIAAVSPIEVSYVWDAFPEGCKGVRIHASTNSIEQLLEHKADPSVKY